MEAIYDSIKSFSHIDEKQFTKHFEFKKEESYIPTFSRVTNGIVMTEL